MANDEFNLDVVQAAELKYAFQRNGWTNADVKRFCGGDMAAHLLPVIRGNAEITPIKCFIDLDAAPLLPVDGWEVEEHQKGGQFEWDVTKVKLFLSINQQNGKVIKGHELRKEIEGKNPFNANLLDFLLANPHLIPEEWKGKYVYFWGTTYFRNLVGDRYLRYLCWSIGHWHWSWRYLRNDWYEFSPAAVPAS